MPPRQGNRPSRDPGGPCPKAAGIGTSRMARETIYLVQAFRAGRGARLSADPPIRCKSSDSAWKAAERLAPTTAGADACSTSGDAEFGDYDEQPTIIFKAGRLPAPFEEA